MSVLSALLAGALAAGAARFQEPAAAPASLGERLAADAYFAKLPLKAAAGYEPIDLWLQEPYGAKPGWEASASVRFGPWMREIAAQFEALFAQPFSLRRGARFGSPSVIVLASEGDLLNFRRSDAGRRSTSQGEASYDPVLDVVVVSATSSERAAHLARFAGLQMLVLRELVAHGEDGARPPLWLRWGLPAYLAWNTGFGPDSLRKREIDRASLTDWIVAADGTPRGSTLLPLSELVGAPDVEAAAAAFGRGAAAAGAKPTDPPGYLAWCAACLWTHYLVDGDLGRRRDGYGAYLASALRGRGDATALREALQLDEAGLRLLERGFDDWARRTADALNLFVEEAPAAATEPPPAAEPVPALPPIAPQPGEVALAHGLALVLAREGDLDGAISALEAAAAVDPEGALSKRVARDLERARGFRELRARFLQARAASGELLALERDGKRLNVRVAAVEADRVRLREAKGGIDAVPFAELPSFGLARQMERDAGWLRYWPYALVDDARWQSQLDAKEPGAAELRADAAEWYPGALRLGAVARALAEVDAGEPPAEPEAAAALAERIGALLVEHGALAEVDSRRASLRARAASCLERAWDPARLDADLAGRVELLDGGRARLTYAFDDAAEHADFEHVALYPAERFGDAPPLMGDNDYTVAGGKLAGSGSHTWRLPLVFRAPLCVSARLSVGSVPEGGNSVVYWGLGACDDGAGNLVLLEDLGSLVVYDRPGQFFGQAMLPPFQELRSAPYTLELAHDGTTLRSRLDGAPQKELSAATRVVGGVIVTVHSDSRLSFDEIVVEGLLEPEPNRARWIERRLAALGL